MESNVAKKLKFDDDFDSPINMQSNRANDDDDISQYFTPVEQPQLLDQAMDSLEMEMMESSYVPNPNDSREELIEKNRKLALELNKVKQDYYLLTYDMKDTVDDLKVELEKISKAHNRVQNRMKSKVKENEELQHKLALSTLRDDEIPKKLKSLEDSLQEKDRELNMIKSNGQAQINQMHATLNERSFAIEQLQARETELTGKLQMAETNCYQSSLNIQHLTSTIEAMNNEKMQAPDTNQLFAAIQSLEAQLHNAKQEKSSTDNQHEELKLKFNSLQDEYAKMSDQVLEQKRGNDHLQEKVSSLESQLSAKDIELTAAYQNMTELIGDNAARTEEVKKLNSSLETMKNESIQAPNTDKLIAEIKSLEDQLQSIKQEKATVDFQNEGLKMKFDELQDECTTMSKQLSEQKLQLPPEDDLQKKLTSLESQLSAKDKELMEANSHMACLEDDKAALREQLDGLREEMMDMRDNFGEAEKLQDDIEKLQAQLSKAKSHMVRLEDENAALREELKDMQDNFGEAEKLQEDIDRLQIQLNEAKAHNTFIESSHELSFEQIASSDNGNMLEYLEAKKEIDDVRAHVMTLSAYIVDKETELEQTKKALEESLHENKEKALMIDELRCKLEDSDESEAMKTMRVHTIKLQNKIDELEEQIKNFNSSPSVEHKHVQAEDLTQKLEIMSRENESLKAALRDYQALDDENKILTDDNTQMKETIKDLLSKIPIKAEKKEELDNSFGGSTVNAKPEIDATLTAQLEDLKAQLKSEVLKNQQQLSEINVLKETTIMFDEVKKDALKLAEKLRSYENEMIESKREHETLEAKHAMALTLIEQLKGDETLLNEKIAYINQLEVKLAEASTVIEELKVAQSKSFSDLAASNAKLATHQKIISELKSSKASLEIQVTDKDNQIEERALHIYDLKAQIVELQSTIIIKDEKISQIEAEFQDTKMRQKARTADSYNKEGAEDMKIKELTEKLGEVEAIKARVAKELTMCQFQLAEANATIEGLKRDNDILNTKYHEECSENYINKRKFQEELTSVMEKYFNTSKERKKTSKTPKLNRSRNDEEDKENSARKFKTQDTQRSQIRHSLHDANRHSLSPREAFTETETRAKIIKEARRLPEDDLKTKKEVDELVKRYSELQEINQKYKEKIEETILKENRLMVDCEVNTEVSMTKFVSMETFMALQNTKNHFEGRLRVSEDLSRELQIKLTRCEYLYEKAISLCNKRQADIYDLKARLDRQLQEMEVEVAAAAVGAE